MIATRITFLSLTASLLLLTSGCSGSPTLDPAIDEQASDPAIQLTGRIVDAADILSSKTETLLHAKLETLERQTGPQFVIATTKNLNGLSIDKYSLELAKSWGVGHAERNDGVVLLVAPNERRVRIEVGYGLEKTLTNDFCAQVIQETILPEFRDGDFNQGVILGADRLIAKMQMSPTITLNDNAPSKTPQENLAS